MSSCRAFLLLILLLSMLGVNAQDEISPAKGIYKQIMGELGKGNMRAVDSLAVVMYNVADEHLDTANMANALTTQAMMAMYSGKYDKADSLISLAFRTQGQLDSAIHYELDVVDKLPLTDSFGLTQAYSNVSSSFWAVGNSKKRKHYLDLALAYSKDNSASKGEVLYKLCDYEIDQGNIDLAYEYASRSLASYKGLRSKGRLKEGYLSMAKVHIAKAEYKIAKNYLDSVSTLIQRDKLVFNVEYLLARLDLTVKTKEPLPTSVTVDQIVTVVEEKDHLENKVHLYNLLNQYHLNDGNYEKAEEALKKSIHYESKRSSRRNIQTVNNLEELYKAEQKELKIENLELVNSRQRQRLLGGGIALVLISLLSFCLFRLYKKVNSQKGVIHKALSEKDLLLREIHHECGLWHLSTKIYTIKKT